MQRKKNLKQIGIYFLVMFGAFLVSLSIYNLAQGVEIDLKSKDELREAYAEEFRFPLILISKEDEKIADRVCRGLRGPGAFAIGINIQGSLMCTYSPMKLIKLEAPEYLCNIYGQKLDKIENFIVICKPKTKFEKIIEDGHYQKISI